MTLFRLSLIYAHVTLQFLAKLLFLASLLLSVLLFTITSNCAVKMLHKNFLLFFNQSEKKVQMMDLKEEELKKAGRE
jgi:hypothetical protein